MLEEQRVTARGSFASLMTVTATVTSNLINVCLEPLYASDELCLLTGTSWFFTSETDAVFLQ